MPDYAIVTDILIYTTALTKTKMIMVSRHTTYAANAGATKFAKPRGVCFCSITRIRIYVYSERCQVIIAKC